MPFPIPNSTRKKHDSAKPPSHSIGILVGCIVVGQGCLLDARNDRESQETNSIELDPVNSDSSTGASTEDESSSTPENAEESNLDAEEGDDSGDISPNVKFDLAPLPDGYTPPEPFCSKVDILFVIDDSKSMKDEQDNLSISVPGFVHSIENTLDLSNVHIGVVATDEYGWNLSGCRELGDLVVKTGGSDSSAANCGPFSGNSNFMTTKDDLESKFPCTAKLGTSGSSDERPMDAMLRALTPKTEAGLSCNAGFLRDDALLVTVIISDEEDDQRLQNGEQTGSMGDPNSWYEAIVASKNSIPENIVVLSLIGIPYPNSCTVTTEAGEGVVENGAEIGVRIRQFTEMMGVRGFVGDVCAPSYAPFFDEAVEVVKSACEKFIPPG